MTTPATFSVNLLGHNVIDDEETRDYLQVQVEAFLEGSPDLTRIPFSLGNCCECGEYVRGHLDLVDGCWVATLRNPACPFPGGMPAFETFIDVPSGVLVFGSNLCPAFPEVPPFKHNINQSVGIRAHNEEYAGLGLAYMMARSHGMRVSMDRDGLCVGEEGWGDGEDEDARVPLPGRDLGRIKGNGLRAVCAMDLDCYEQRGRQHGVLDAGLVAEVARVREHFRTSLAPTQMEPNSWDSMACLAVKVPAGRYKVVHLDHTLRGERGQVAISARIEPA